MNGWWNLAKRTVVAVTVLHLVTVLAEQPIVVILLKVSIGTLLGEEVLVEGLLGDELTAGLLLAELLLVVLCVAGQPVTVEEQLVTVIQSVE